jgi:hypothetical protein
MVGVAPAGVAASQATLLAVSPTGNDAGPCTQGVPCASLGRAYEIAPAGAVIEVGSGSYPAQRIVRNRASEIDATITTIRPVTGGTVRLQSLTLGDGEGGNGPHHLRIESISIPDEPVEIREDAQDVELRNVSGANFHIVGARGVRIIGGSWGPCLTDGVTSRCANSKVDAAPSPSYQTTDILIQGAHFHDYRIVPNSGAHFECLFLRAGTNIRVLDSTFTACEFFDIFVQPSDPSVSFGGLRIERNVFQSPYDGNGGNVYGRAVMLSGRGYVWNNVAIRRNSIIGAVFSLDDGTSAGWTGIEFSGNIGETVEPCKPGVRYENNLLARSRCGTTDIASAPYGYLLADARLTVDPQRARAVQTVFRLRAAGRQVSNIARDLRKSGLPRPPFGWSPRGVALLLADSRYLGGVYGPAGAHPRLVAQKVWKATQTVKQRGGTAPRS